MQVNLATQLYILIYRTYKFLKQKYIYIFFFSKLRFGIIKKLILDVGISLIELGMRSYGGNESWN